MATAPSDPATPNPIGDLIGGVFDFFTAPIRGVFDALQFTLGEPLAGETFQQAEPITEDQMGILIEGARQQGLSDDQINSLFQLSNIGASPAVIQDRIFKLQRENQIQGFLKPFEEQRQEALDVSRRNIQESIGTARETKSRFENILNQPGAIRSDEDFGTALATAENQINAQTLANESALASATAGSGLRSSGSAAQQVLLGRERAASSKASAQGRLKSEARNRLDTANTRLDELLQAQGSIEKGFLPEFLQGAAFNAGSLATSDPINDVLGVSVGAEEARRGAGQQVLGTLFGAAQTAGDQQLNLLDTIFSNIFNG